MYPVPPLLLYMPAGLILPWDGPYSPAGWECMSSCSFPVRGIACCPDPPLSAALTVDHTFAFLILCDPVTLGG